MYIPLISVGHHQRPNSFCCNLEMLRATIIAYCSAPFGRRCGVLVCHPSRLGEFLQRRECVRTLWYYFQRVVDVVSWSVILQDLESFFRDESVSELSGTTFKEWSTTMKEIPQFDAQLEYWDGVSTKATEFAQLSGLESWVSTPNSLLASEEATITLSETESLCSSSLAAYNLQVQDLLMGALVKTLGEWQSTSFASFFMESNGRDLKIASDDYDMELHDTVGWFTSLFPVCFEIRPTQTLHDFVIEMKRQLREVPNHGIGYGYLRYNKRLLSTQETAITFNYIGRQDIQESGDKMLVPIRLGEVPALGLRNHATSALDVLCQIDTSGLFRVKFTKVPALDIPLRHLTETFMSYLRQLIGFCSSREERYLTPADFPLLPTGTSTDDLSSVVPTFEDLEDAYSISPSQQGIALHRIMNPDSDEYHVQTVVNYGTECNMGLLKSSWEYLFSQYAIFRTGFAFEGKGGFQFVLRNLVFPWTMVDTNCSFESLLAEDKKHLFDLSKPPLMRFTLVKLKNNSWKLIWSYHHILFDGWSVPIVLKHVQSVYDSMRRNLPPRLPPSRPYKDFIAHLAFRKANPQTFWKNYLKAVNVTYFEDDKTLLSVNDEKDVKIAIELGQDDSNSITSLIKVHSITMNTFILACLSLALTSLLGDDSTFGVLLSGRSENLVGIAESIGLFINICPFHATTDPKHSVLSLLRKIQSTMLDLSQNSHLPLLEIQGMMNFRPKSDQSLFQLLYVFENYPESESVSSLEVFERTQYPLTVLASVEGEKVDIGLKCKPRFYQAGRKLSYLLEALLRVVPTLLRENGETLRVSDIKFPSNEEAASIWNFSRRGHVAVWNEKGEPEYVEKTQETLKLEGYYVNFKLLENALNVHPEVSETFVTQAKLDNQSFLVAYVASPSLAQLTALEVYQTLSSFIKASPLKYRHLPSHYIAVASFPGDKELLPKPSSLPFKGEGQSVDPSIFFKVSELLKALLCLEDDTPVDLDDDFFELGGNSLLVVHLINKLNRHFGCSMTVTDLFENSTVRNLCLAIAEGRTDSHIISSQDSLPSIQPVPESRLRAGIRLSYGQQRMWVMHNLVPRPLYNISTAYQITGPLDVDKLSSALQHIFQRHTALRTIIKTSNNEALQCIEERTVFPLHITQIEDRRELRDIIKAEEETIFDLAHGPLIRGRLVHLPHDDKSHCVLILTMHHLVADGWSLDLIRRELSQLYNGEQLLEPKIQFGSFSEWHHNLVENSLKEQERYWLAKLEGAPDGISLPYSFSRPKELDYSGDLLLHPISEATLRKIKKIGTENQMTNFMIFLAGLQILFSRITQEPDVVVGTVFSNRQNSELADLVGYLANTVLIRTSCQGSILDILHKVKTAVLEAQKNQDLPFEKLVHLMHQHRATNTQPLFNVLFSWEAQDVFQLKLNDLDVVPLERENSKIARMDLIVTVTESANSTHLRFEYSTELFTRQFIERLAKMYEHVLLELSENEQNPVEDFSLISGEDVQIFTEVNCTTQALETVTIRQSLSQQIKEKPDNNAIIFGDVCVSYTELSSRVEAMAYHCRNITPVNRKDVIGICLERSSMMVTSMLAAWKLGAAYLPIDPSLPLDRIQYMLEEANVKVILTEAKHFHLFSDHNGLVDVWDISNESSVHFAENLEGSDLAYCMYTSGSTGRPKGVMIEHASLNNRIMWMQDAFQLEPTDVVLQKTPFTFDVSVWEFFWPLSVGATLLVAPPESHKDPFELLKLIEDRKVSVCHFVPSMLSAFISILNKDNSKQTLRSLKKVFVSGEALSLDLNQKFFEFFPEHTELHNLYGPTEATIDVSHFKCSPDNRGIKSSVPIGKPVWNTELLVLDKHLKMCPVGIPGELFIGGCQLARGYLNREELTQKAFIPHPFKPHEKLYKTGDLVRQLEDGNIEYLGRLDFQVKLRGLRIELGEIESVIRGYSLVNQAAVCVRSETTLVAYVTLTSSSTQDLSTITSDVRAFAGQFLPSYMVPQHVIVLKEIPLDRHGKLKKSDLPDFVPNSAEGQEGDQFSPELVKLCQIVSDVLKIPSVHPRDDFFALGGESILAIQLVNLIRTSFKKDIPLKAIFENSIIQDLSEAIASSVNISQPIPKIPDDIKKNGVRLSYGQKRIWFLQQLIQKPIYNLSVAFSLNGDLDIGRLEFAINHIIDRHEILRTAFSVSTADPENIEDEEFLVQQVLPASSFQVGLQPFEISEASVALALEDFTDQEFDLRQGPLFRVRLFKLLHASKKYIFAIAMHHIITDGWSIDVLREELTHFYNEPTLELALPAVQYSDFSEWHQASGLEEQRAYWEEKLRGIPEILELPTSTRPKETSYTGTRFDYLLSSQTRAKLMALSSQFSATPFMTLLSLLSIVFHRYTSQESIVIGSPIANRQHPDLRKTMGFFANTIALRLDLQALDTFAVVMEQAKRVCLEAYQNQDIPFEQVIQGLDLVRHTDRHPVFQVMLIWQSLDTSELVLKELSCVPIEQPTRVARFDLSLYATDHKDGVLFAFEYAIELFEEHFIKSLAGQLDYLLNMIPEHTEQPISVLKYFPESPQTHTMGTSKDLPCQNILELFKETVQKHPHGSAVTFQEESITYTQLDSWSDKLGHHMLSLGATPNSIISVSLPRSLELVVTLLAIMKIGCSYQPIYPHAPSKRLKIMLEEAKPALLCTLSALRGQFPLAEEKIVSVDDLSSLPEPKTSLPSSHISSASLAYILFTSGSTGIPKGVMVEHGGLVNRLLWMQDEFKLDPTDVVLQKTPFTFDVSVWEFFWPLIIGASLLVAPPESHKDPFELLRMIEKKKVSVCHFVPSMLSAFISILDQKNSKRQLHSLKKVFVSGEALTMDLNRKFFEFFPEHTELHNLYGPTEATIDVSHFKCSSDNRNIKSSVPIGKPVWNTELLVLDKNLQVVPIGIPGELFIGGCQLARGYLNQEELTRKSFIPHPFKAQERLYKTGDLVKWLADGNIEYLGRLDFQVKLRGLRIELGEIEQLLLQIPCVKDSVVLVHQHQDRKQLLAYVVLTPSGSTQQVEYSVKDYLPEYMLPTVLSIEALPLTATGKLDRNVSSYPLPSFDTEEETTDSSSISTELEMKIASLMAKVLGEQHLKVTANFFKSGGDSILCIRLVHLAQACSIAFSLQDIFNHPTPRALAMCVSTKKNSVCSTQTCSEVAVLNQEQRFPLLPIQRWLLEQRPKNINHWNQSIILSSSSLDNSTLQEAVNLLVKSHPALRLRFDLENSSQYYSSKQEKIRCEFVEISSEKQIEIVSKQLHESLDVVHGPVFNFAVLSSNDQHLILLVAHHLVVDALSWETITSSLSSLYTKVQSGSEIIENFANANYHKWCTLLESKQKDLSEETTQYWSRTLNKIEKFNNPFEPLDDTYANERKFTTTLDEAVTSRLMKIVMQKAGYHLQPQELILASIALTFRDIFGTSDLPVALEGHGREARDSGIEIFNTVGWFTTLFPVCLSLPAIEDQIHELLIGIKEELRGVPDKGLSFGLMSRGQPDKIANVPVLFNFFGQLYQRSESQEGEIFSRSEDCETPKVSLENQRPFTFEIISGISESKLSVFWNYSSNRFSEDTMSVVSETFKQKMELLISHCHSTERQILSPSDFPLVSLTQRDIDTICETVKDSVEDIYSLSPTQAGLLMHSLHNQTGDNYLVQSAFEISHTHREVDFSLLREAWQLVVDSHDILRSKFLFLGLSAPVQVILSNFAISWDHEKMSAQELQENSRAEILEKVLHKERSSFKFQEAPIFLKHLEVGSVSFLLVTYHHIILDGWSLPILLNKVKEVYDKLSAKAENAELVVTSSFKNYLEKIRSIDPDMLEKFWKDYLVNLEQLTTLPFSPPPVDKARALPSHSSFALTLENCEQLHHFSTKHGLTMNSLVQGAFSLLLSRYCSVEDVLFGVTLSGRTVDVPGIEEMLGVFINTVPYRQKVSQNSSVLEFFKSVQKSMLDVMENGLLPLSKIQKLSELSKTTKLNLFEILFVFENYPSQREKRDKKGLHLEPLKYVEKSEFPLVLLASYEEDEGLHLQVTYMNEKIPYSKFFSSSRTILPKEKRETRRVCTSNLSSMSKRVNSLWFSLPVTKKMKVFTYK
eukprot:TRINITY_DN2405_c0_g1_i3.p1 TRINITY_DN2405_c0_g1~~TRINITY_DN2405_c0_g1_i3.p1  ORF type:complete len:4081 (-),score=672.67 TRINITY_DN2405_c0_g1_i3:3059-15301(-)